MSLFLESTEYIAKCGNCGHDVIVRIPKKDDSLETASSASNKTASLRIALTLLKKWTEWYASAASVPVGNNFALNYQTHEFLEEQRQA